jgi:transcription termination/antitermination protein NusA
VDDEMARSFYRLGFRALEEVAEASTEELFGVDGIESPEQADKLRKSALESMERLRLERFEAAKSALSPLGERDKLRLVKGVGVRTLQLLEEASLRTVRDVAQASPDQLANAGLDAAKAKEVHHAAVHFMDSDLPELTRQRALSVRNQGSFDSGVEDSGA